MTEETYTTLKDALTRPENTTQYAALDVISAPSDAHFTFGKDGKRIVHPGNAGGMSGVITGARLHSSANQGTLPDIDLYLYRTDIAAVADSGAFAPTDAEALTLLGIIEFPVGSWKAQLVTAGAGGNAVCRLTGLELQFMLADPDFMFGQMVVQNTYTPVSGEIFTCELDIKRFGH